MCRYSNRFQAIRKSTKASYNTYSAYAYASTSTCRNSQPSSAFDNTAHQQSPTVRTVRNKHDAAKVQCEQTANASSLLRYHQHSAPSKDTMSVTGCRDDVLQQVPTICRNAKPLRLVHKPIAENAVEKAEKKMGPYNQNCVVGSMLGVKAARTPHFNTPCCPCSQNACQSQVLQFSDTVLFFTLTTSYCCSHTIA